MHITWQDANTLRVDTDAGTQTRLLHFTPSSFRDFRLRLRASQLAGGFESDMGARDRTKRRWQSARGDIQLARRISAEEWRAV